MFFAKNTKTFIENFNDKYIETKQQIILAVKYKINVHYKYIP